MASFEVKRRDTGIIYTIKVSEFVFRNTFGTNSQGIVSSLEPTGYTSITTIGDNIVQKLGDDALTQGAWFDFVNHPDYALHLASVNKIASNVERISDPTKPSSEFQLEYVYDAYFGSIDVTKNDNKIATFASYYKVDCHDVAGNVILNSLPNFLIQKEPLIGSTFAFNFIQKQIAIISPYYYQVQNFQDGKVSFIFNAASEYRWGNCSAVYIGKPFTIKNSATDSRYNYNTGDEISSTTLKTFADLDSMQYIGTAGAFLNSTPISTYTMQLRTGNYTIDGKNIYDFWYWLLNDTDAENNPYPDDNKDNPDNPSGQSPPNIGGNPSGGNPATDSIIFPTLPTVNPVSTGSVNLYQMSAQTFREFMSYIWSNPFYTAFIKLFENPMEAVISAHILGAIVPTSGSDYITIGNVTTPVTANIVPNNFISVDFGNLSIDEFYKDASDYLDTVVELYLPYYGNVTLNIMEVMNATINVRYNIDVLTGAFVAMVRVMKNVEDTNLDSVLYQYNGQMTYSIPLSSVDYSSIVTAVINGIGALSQKKISKVADGLLNAALSVDIGYDRAGNLSSNVGYMSVKQAYITILRPVHNLPPNFAKYMGFPYEGYVNLGGCSGFTKCREVFIDTIYGTPEETDMIRNALLQGVFL